MESLDDDISRLRTVGPWLILLIAVAMGAHLISCRSTPPIRSYQPEVARGQLDAPSEKASDVVLAVEDFSANAAYNEQRIVYRTDGVQINYYHYHRWAAPPGLLVSDMLQQVYLETNQFQSVIGGFDSRADVVLGGRVVRFEEYDTSEDDWQAQVVLEMRLRAASTGDLLWDKQWTESIDLDDQSPVGVARGVGIVLTQIGRKTAPEIVERAEQYQRQQDQSSGLDSSSSSSKP